MRKVVNLVAHDDWTLTVTFASSDVKVFDLKPLLSCEAFAALSDLTEFKRFRNGGYYVEWENGADLSADTLYLEGS
jgi:hypothetical protein